MEEPSLGDPPLIPDEEDETSESEGSRGLIPDGVKKALLAGVGALFLSEEGARRLAREWKLPKDVVSFVGQQASAAKDEILRLLGQEMKRFLESETMRAEFLRALSDSTIEIRAQIRVRPDAKGTLRTRLRGAARRPKTRTRGR